MMPMIQHQTKQLNKILIANRGEIAVRIIRACQELGIRTVAVYSEADAHALHVRLADQAVPIGPPPPQDSYLRADRIIAAAKSADVQAIHPGFGFLSENADFADAVRGVGLIFIGPDGDAIRQMGSKTRARALMQHAGVPVVPGYEGGLEADFGEAAGTIGYPVLIKAAAGGGGKGMRIVLHPKDLEAAIDSAQREAEKAFGDPTIFVEKYIEGARHIEFQVFGDAHGNIMQLFERECSTQRRHQKIIEETPSPLVDDVLRGRMGQTAVAAARAVNYQNAGTIEFIVDPQRREFYFLEMNTRLQVEHPITEMVTGIDLVKLQINVAMGEPLPFRGNERVWSRVSSRGHAIECRVYAEDAANGFLPATGPVLKAVFPSAPGVRVDTGIESGDEVSIYYDPMLAKIIALGQNRADAIRKMDWALAHTVILGITTNIRFLRDVLAHPSFVRGEVTTDFVEHEFAAWQPHVSDKTDLALIAAALSEVTRDAPSGPPRQGAGHGQGRFANMRNADSSEQGARYDPWQVNDGFRVGGA